jgi:hypothetical protein
MKICNICKSSKPFSEFSKSNTARGDGYQYTCKLCNTIEKRKWREANQNKNRNTKYLKKFGITLEEVLNILKNQNNKCAICSLSVKLGSKTHLDHDHLTGNIRGVLCQKCNHGIGLFNDSTQILKSAILYLNKHAKKENQ